MKIIEITPLPNGAHRNQETSGTIYVPNGWAIIGDDISIPSSFPFVNITVEDGHVESIEAGVIPEIAPEEVIPSQEDDMNALIVDHEYRLTLLELGLEV